MGFAKTPTSNHFVGLAPDRQWLALMRSRSRGALKRWTPRPFDPDAEFVFRYHQRRANLEDYKLSSGGDDGHAVLRVQNK